MLFLPIIFCLTVGVIECLEQDPLFLASEPRKLEPKMTVVGILNVEIITSITEKSINIKQLLNKDCTLELFT